MSPLLSRYLLFYNSFQALGWTISLLRILSNLISTKSVSGTYSSAGELICFLQCLAFLEVIHGAIGIVPSGALFPLMQWGGRTHFILAIVLGIDEVRELPTVFITFLVWSLSEVIRYSHYAISSSGSPPFWITYLSVAHVSSTSIYKGKEPLCKVLFCPPYQLLYVFDDSADFLPIYVVEIVPALVETTIIKAW